MFVMDGGSESRMVYLTEMSRNSTEVSEIVQENLRVGWKDWIKEKKEFSCSWENKFVPIQ